MCGGGGGGGGRGGGGRDGRGELYAVAPGHGMEWNVGVGWYGNEVGCDVVMSVVGMVCRLVLLS